MSSGKWRPSRFGLNVFMAHSHTMSVVFYQDWVSVRLHNRGLCLFGDHDDVIKWKHIPYHWPFVRGNPLVTGGIPSHRAVTQSCDVFFDLRLNKRLSKHSGHRWFETPWCPLWRHCDADLQYELYFSQDSGSASSIRGYHLNSKPNYLQHNMNVVVSTHRNTKRHNRGKCTESLPRHHYGIVVLCGHISAILQTPTISWYTITRTQHTYTSKKQHIG